MEVRAGRHLIADDITGFAPPPAGGAVLLVETRPSFWIGPVLRRAAALHPGWPVYVCGPPEVLRLASEAVGTICGLALASPSPRMSVADYSQLLMTDALWAAVREPWVLIVQLDVVLVRPVRAEHLDFDFVGAACGDVSSDATYVINGGLSLRRVASMREVCRRLTPGERALPEDVAFTRAMRRLGGYALPTIAQCHAFSIESMGDPSRAVGIHGVDKYYAPRGLVAALLGTPRRRVVDVFSYGDGDAPLARLRLALLSGVVARFVVATPPARRGDPVFAPYAAMLTFCDGDAWDGMKACATDDVDALFMLSHVSEIPDPTVVADVDLAADAVASLEMTHLLYSWSWRKPAPWRNALLLGAGAAGRCARPVDVADRDVIPEAGWYCDAFGGQSKTAMVRGLDQYDRGDHENASRVAGEEYAWLAAI